MSESVTKDQCLSLIRDLAIAFEGEHPCKCSELHTPVNPKLATGHVRGCPVDEAVHLRREKAPLREAV